MSHTTVCKYAMASDTCVYVSLAMSVYSGKPDKSVYLIVRPHTPAAVLLTAVIYSPHLPYVLSPQPSPCTHLGSHAMIEGLMDMIVDCGWRCWGLRTASVLNGNSRSRFARACATSTQRSPPALRPSH